MPGKIQPPNNSLGNMNGFVGTENHAWILTCKNIARFYCNLRTYGATYIFLLHDIKIICRRKTNILNFRLIGKVIRQEADMYLRNVNAILNYFYHNHE